MAEEVEDKGAELGIKIQNWLTTAMLALMMLGINTIFDIKTEIAKLSGTEIANQQRFIQIDKRLSRLEKSVNELRKR